MSEANAKSQENPQTQDLSDLFQIAVINSKPQGRAPFDWVGFDPQNVQSPNDLPAYLLFGPLDASSFICTAGGWHAEWKDSSQKAKVVMTWTQASSLYSISQSWDGEPGSSVEAASNVSLFQALAALYKDGFPSNWDERAKVKAESAYHITWLEAQKENTVIFAAPDGVFRTVSFPVMVKNIRNARAILQKIADKGLPFGFFATATLVGQEIEYKVGTAPDWTRDIAACITQSIGEIGLIPLAIPERMEKDGGEYVALSRDVMMLNIHVPFAGIFPMLSELSETPMPVVGKNEAPIRRELLAFVAPQGISGELNGFTIEDAQQGINVSYKFLAPELSLDELLAKDSEQQVAGLEAFSDNMIEQLAAEVQESPKVKA